MCVCVWGGVVRVFSVHECRCVVNVFQLRPGTAYFDVSDETCLNVGSWFALCCLSHTEKKAPCLKPRGSFALDTVKACRERFDSIAANHRGHNKWLGKA